MRVGGFVCVCGRECVYLGASVCVYMCVYKYKYCVVLRAAWLYIVLNFNMYDPIYIYAQGK